MIHELERRWLATRGGRTYADVLVDEKGEKFVYMSGQGIPVRVYVPSVEVLRTLKWGEMFQHPTWPGIGGYGRKSQNTIDKFNNK